MMQMKLNILGAAALIAGLGAVPVAAQSTQGVLVELFTSQGCSSCPPADAVLEKLSQTAGVIPLALHVDYWDYIGWTDTFAQEKFSKRQRRYATAISENMVYTPQMIVAGGARVRGYDAGEARTEIGRAQTSVALNLQRQGDEVQISATPMARLAGNYVVDIIRYRPQSVVSIERGENRGRQIAYHNIVTTWENVGKWDGQGALSMRTRAAGDAPIVVIIQSAGPGEVVAAAVLK